MNHANPSVTSLRHQLSIFPLLSTGHVLGFSSDVIITTGKLIHLIFGVAKIQENHQIHKVKYSFYLYLVPVTAVSAGTTSYL